MTSTGTPEGSDGGIGFVEHHFGEERQARAIRGGERVVRRELGFAGDEAHLALERAVDAVDAQRGRRADLHARANGLGHVYARERRGGGEQHGDRGAARGLFAEVKGQRVDGAGDRRAHFEPRGGGFETLRDVARALSAAWRACASCSARVPSCSSRRSASASRSVASAASAAADLPVGFRFAHQAARHEAQQPVAFAHGVVALHARRVAARGGGADGGAARAVLEFLDARLGLGELRARGVEFGGRKRAILHHDDVAGLHRRAFGERQRDDGFVRIGDQFDAIALERAGQGAFVVARAGGEQQRACERGEGAQCHAANSKRMDRSTACTCLVMPPMEM